MKKKMLSKFQTEELEQRYEMGWKAKSVDVEYKNGQTEFKSKAKLG